MGEFCFWGCTRLSTVEISASISSIEAGCFMDCVSIVSIKIPQSVTILGERCFAGCSMLSSVVIPASVITIKDNCFSKCTSLASISIPSSVKTIGLSKKDMSFFDEGQMEHKLYDSSYGVMHGCFSGCTKLTSIVIPSSVSSLGVYCFAECINLKSVLIPSSVTSLDIGCFYKCSNLNTIAIPSSITSLGVRCFQDCEALDSVKIPLSVVSIGDNCFDGCAKITSIVIPSSVMDIRSWSLACNNLKTVYSYAINPPTASDTYTVTSSVSFGQPSETLLYVPSSSIDKYKQADAWKDFIAILPIPGTESEIKGQCEKPVITFDGNLHFESSTTGANYHYTISSNDMTTEAYSENGDVALQAAYNITAYATADDYSPSDKATATLYWIGGVTDDPTGINANTKRGIVVSTQNGTVTLSGLDDGERVSFYSVSGSNLGTATANNGTATSTFATGQIIIAKVGNTSMKIAL